MWTLNQWMSLQVFVSYLCDPWVGTLAVDAIVLQPLVLRVGAVLFEGAAVLSFAPNTPKQWVRLQTQATASTLCVALVQMNCADEEKKGREEEKIKWKEMKVKAEGERV